MVFLRKLVALVAVAVLVASSFALLAGDAAARRAEVGICHLTDEVDNPVIFIRVAESAVQAHLDHGDSLAPNGPSDCQPVANTPPIAADDGFVTDEDTPLIVGAPGVLGNDSDADGDALTAIPDASPASGFLTLNPDGSFTYTPAPNFTGIDSFTYLASDGQDTSNLATVTIAVNAVNDPPVAVDDAYGTDEDTPLSVAAPGVLGNDGDVDGDALSAILASGPASGTVILNPDGSFDYAPNAGFNGVDSFQYFADDGTTDVPATVTIAVNAVNDPPIAVDDAAATDFETPVIVAVLANDSDPDGDALLIGAFGQGANGSVADNGDGTLTYTPNAGFSGTDSFTYAASDGLAASNTATVTVEVGAPPCGDVQAQVNNAANGFPIDGAAVELLLTADSSVVQTGTTDLDGGFLFACVPAAPDGTYTLRASATGFSTGTVPVPAVLPAATTQVAIALVPASPCSGGANGPITIVLTWGATPSDLDSHLSGPDGAGGRFHVAYFDKEPVDHASLDVDDVTSFGPETVTVTISPVDGQFVAGEYRYWVHDYTNRDGVAQWGVSNALVTVTQCDEQVAQYQVADAGTSALTLWHVFNFDVTADGTVTVTAVQSFASGGDTTVL